MSLNCLYCQGGESLNTSLLDSRTAWKPPLGLSISFNPPGETRRKLQLDLLYFFNGDAEFQKIEVLFAYNETKSDALLQP